MHRNKFDLNGFKVYDTSMFTKIKREKFLNESHLKFLNMSLEPYENYIRFTEDYLNSTAVNFQQKHLNALEENATIYNKSEEYARRMMELDGEFSQHFRQSMIVQLFSFLERALVSSCELYYSNKEEDKNDTTFMPDKAGFDEVKVFLKNQVKIKLSEINMELDFFSKLRAVRNRIVHHGTTFFNDEDSKINNIKAISKNRFIFTPRRDFEVTYHIYFDNPAFSFEIIEKIKSLYKKLGERGVYY